MRILALHGNRQNGEVFRTRLGPVVRRLEDAGHRVFFVDAPHEVPMGPGDEVPMRTWWTREGGDGAGTSGWDESLAALRGVWTSRGPFQGIVGFSQGAAAGLILCELADAADASFASLRCAVLCAGYALPSRDAIDRPAISGRVRVMLIAGDADEAVPPAETLACASRVHPSTVTIYRHSGNHLFPAKSRDARAVADFFDAEEVGTLEFGTPLPGDGDGDGDGIAIPEEVAEELAALAAIFDEEMRTESPADDGPGSTTLSFTLPGVAEAMDPTDPSSYDPRLVLIVPREYPAALPARPCVGSRAQSRIECERSWRRRLGRRGSRAGAGRRCSPSCRRCASGRRARRDARSPPGTSPRSGNEGTTTRSTRSTTTTRVRTQTTTRKSRRTGGGSPRTPTRRSSRPRRRRRSTRRRGCGARGGGGRRAVRRRRRRGSMDVRRRPRR